MKICIPFTVDSKIHKIIINITVESNNSILLLLRKFTNNPNISHSSLKTVYVNKMTKISEFDSWTN